MELKVEVAYAGRDEQALVCVQLPAGASLRDAVERSGLLARFPEIDLAAARVGVFGKLRRLDEPVGAGDRVEIYRELITDPKEARRKRAKRKES